MAVEQLRDEKNFRKAPDFCSLADWLMPIPEIRVATSVVEESRDEHDVMEGTPMSVETYTSSHEDEQRSPLVALQPHDQLHTPEEEALSVIERFRVLAVERIEESVKKLLIAIADEVLMRELVLSPADIQALLAQALRRFEREGPVRLRVAPEDVQRVTTDLPVIADAHLQAGDLVIEVRDGELESRLSVRLACAMHRFGNEANMRSIRGETRSRDLRIA